MRLTNIPGIVFVFARMYIQYNVMQCNTLFIIFVLDLPTLCRERRYFFLSFFIYLFVYESQDFVTWSLLGRERYEALGMQ